MANDICAELEQLWQHAASPPDIFRLLNDRPAQLPEQLCLLIQFDQSYRWKWDSPWQVEDYLARLPTIQGRQQLILDMAAGEFLARLQNNLSPSIDEYTRRFPELHDQLLVKLSGLSSTRPHADTSERRSTKSRGLMDIDEICDAFEDAWSDEAAGKGSRPSIESYLQAAEPDLQPMLLKELLRIELCIRSERGEQPTWSDYKARFPASDPLFADILKAWEANPQEFQLFDRKSTELQGTMMAPVDFMSIQSYVPANVSNTFLGRYRIHGEVGKGAFGRVHKAYDEELQRPVAIKVPRKSRFRKPEDAETYLAEARTVAKLEHPNIVPVYDMGRTEDGSVYVVSRLIEGGTLEDLIRGHSLDIRQVVSLMIPVARALHHAHQQRLIHRDIKPANILIETRTQTPFVADFGLAMREEDYLKQVAIAGTAAYMSPEQARAEGHRLDGRSDVFSLGVVLYEMLTGKKPFRGRSMHETLHQVISVEAQPPRSVVDTIPPELERICLRAMSKKASDRYATAELMAEDLEAWLNPATLSTAEKSTHVAVTPRGLRSFDANDADFFLELLPGPRNRNGLPESIAFWKQRIEETDPDKTFSVGLLYGPSGCGKSSLVKAGLLPHLSKDVIAVYLEATPEETELRILRGLRKLVPELREFANREGEAPAEPLESGSNVRIGSAGALPSRKDAATADQQSGRLVDAMLHLRRSHNQKKIVIIIDQFEQWLHVHRSESDAELVTALRQCDGGRLQSIVMVRDDFAMASARFMQALDVPILQGVHFATVDLFEIDHAKQVLIRFAQAFGKLPANDDNLSIDELQFVDDVATGLARDGKVVSVRLSLFAEMVKSKPWTRATLKQVGGTRGIGVNFLEETFSSAQANPRHRLHAVAACNVLRSLLPEFGSDIKGHMRSQQELLEASGYGNRPLSGKALAACADNDRDATTPEASAPSRLRIGVESKAENRGTYLPQGGSNEQEVYRTVVRC